MKRNAWYWVSTGLGVGLAPFAPGTLGSALGVLLAYPVQKLTGHGFWWTYGIISVSCIVVGVISSTWLCRYLSVEDPPAAVIDEITAQFMVTSLVPQTWRALLASFLLFRLFDIAKVFPCNLAERLPEGWGVMTDDLIAGVYAVAAYYLLVKLGLPLQ
ncbi:MAG TPA: phosphatidylglycerophosphatase A [Acidobacteriota bacterium]|jgi:phosphatidylglycerophosphatase A|nr:phosphatidylglycerophosphatase A [Acidobacteriota bacterium]